MEEEKGLPGRGYKGHVACLWLEQSWGSDGQLWVSPRNPADFKAHINVWGRCGCRFCYGKFQISLQVQIIAIIHLYVRHLASVGIKVFPHLLYLCLDA